MYKSLKIRWIVGYLSLWLTGCAPDIGNANWDLDVLAPVIKTRLDMGDLVADSLLETDSDGALRLNVEAPLIDFPLDSILKIPDTTITSAFTLPVALNDLPPGTDIFPLSNGTRYDLGDLALKKVILRTGKLRLQIKSIVETEVELNYIIPKAQRFGNVFETTQTIPAGSPGDTAYLELELDLSGYSIELTGPDGTGFNTLTTTAVLTTSENGDTVSIPSNKPFFFLKYGFVDILPDYGTGYFGQQSTSETEEAADIDILSRITDGQMFLDSVKIGLNLINGVGADARFRLNSLTSINSRTNSSVNLTNSIIGSDVILSRAIDLNGTAEDVIESRRFFYLDNGNSNIKSLIENLPDKIGFDFEFDLNPLGNVSSGNDFFYYDRPFEALMTVDIPLRATLSDLTLVDTLDWNLSENEAVESINSGSFTLVANNSFPLEGIIELVLLDENYQLLDTLVVPSTVSAAPVGVDNRVIEALETRISIPVPTKESNILALTKYVRIQVKFNTSSQPDLIQFYEDNMIDIKLIGNLNINLGGSGL